MRSSETDIIKGCLKGNPRFQRALYDMLKTPLYMTCLRYASSQAEAQDFLQESFIQIFRDLKQYDPKRGKLSTWTKRITINTALQHLRKRKMEFDEDGLDKIEHVASHEVDVISRLSAKELTELIQELPEGYRLVFNLYVIEGFTHREIATKLGVKESTSKSQLFKAKALLKKKVQQFNFSRVTQYG